MVPLFMAAMLFFVYHQSTMEKVRHRIELKKLEEEGQVKQESDRKEQRRISRQTTARVVELVKLAFDEKTGEFEEKFQIERSQFEEEVNKILSDVTKIMETESLRNQ
eukprot:TRINITY_DN11534_c0_g1_i1.p1 TRINITY_DN11534_c0_g1~~TRINITY_DN11534_c0_g1_i1.p1  ORF type:complete len:107 (-),score=23.85 TRINITY_DN11534_c0_g1_i1:288-608(-)